MRPLPEFPAGPAAALQLPPAIFDEIECGLIVCDTQGVIAVAKQAAHGTNRAASAAAGG